MLTAVEQLHTTARRFAMDAHARWCAWYDDSGASGRPSSVEARGIYPRYLIHVAMLRAVELFMPAMLPSDLATARGVLAAAIRRASSPSTQRLTGSVEQSAMEEERQAFAAFIETVTIDQLIQTEPLPYRQALTLEEAATRWAPVVTAWSIGSSYWYPLSDSHRNDVIAFAAPEFNRALGAVWLRSVLAARGVERVFEFREFTDDPGYDLDLSMADFCYTGAEGYWCTPALDWLVYASHEESLTLGGGWLIAAARAAWPAWSSHLWTANWS